MASWSQNKESGLRHTRCPVHGSLVVQRPNRSWLWTCADCLADARRALYRLAARVR